MNFEEFEFESGLEYGLAVTVSMQESFENTEDSKDPVSVIVFKSWVKAVFMKCIEKYDKYQAGELESYKLSSEEILKIYDETVSTITSNALQELVASGDVSMSINVDGEIVYKATEQGKAKRDAY